MKFKLGKIISLSLTVCLVLALMPPLSVAASGSGSSVAITDSMGAADIGSAIQNAINGASPGDTVTVTGSKVDGDGWVWLNIPSGVKVVWKAVSDGLSPVIDGGGTFELADGGKIEASKAYAIYVYTGNVRISGGKVSATGAWGSAIYVEETGNVWVSGGEVSVNGDGGNACYAIYIEDSGTVKVTGGKVLAHNANKNFAIALENEGLAAYLRGTCEGEFPAYWFNDSVIVEVEALSVPGYYDGTDNGLTRKDDNGENFLVSPPPPPEWDMSGAVPRIVSGTYAVEWKASEAAPLPAEYPVRLAETGGLFGTLNEAIAVAESGGYDVFTLEVIGDVGETSPVIITSDITIIGAEGAHTVSGALIKVESGGRLTLGDGTNANTLTIFGSVSVTDGFISVKDGVAIKSGGNAALLLSGSNVNGTINGGRFEATGTSAVALSLEKGAKLSEISGGVFYGRIDAAHLTDGGTKIEKISGGEFYQTDTSVTLHGHAVFVQNNSQIGEISGGYFEAALNCALVVIRGGWVGEISGGEFVAKRTGTAANNDRNAAVWVEGETAVTGIGTISGGHFRGTNFGVLVIWRNATAQIDKITGGTFEGTVALQNDVSCVINEISGGSIIGSQGMLNAGKIGYIGGNVDILGKTSYAIYNYSGATIDEIGGGMMVSNTDNGIQNAGTINLISGGKVIGQRSAISCDGMNKGKLEKITSGVFWGKTNTAILLAYDLSLEPELDAVIGFGRYWGKDGVIFNNEDLVKYPGDYFMSVRTKSVEGVTEVEFKYLTLSDTVYEVTFDTNGGNFDDGVETTVREVSPPETTVGRNMPDDPERYGYTFIGWNTEKDGSGTSFTDSTEVTGDVTVYAQWEKDNSGEPQPTYTVTYEPGEHGTFDVVTHSGLEAGSETPAVPATPGENGWVFTGWSPVPSATVTGDAAYIAQWEEDDSGEPPVGPPVEPPVEPPVTPPITPPVTPPPGPFIEDHVAYIIGYPDGTVRPEQNITRAEVATVFFRLLTDELRAANWTRENPFSDVGSKNWYNNAISVISKMGIVNGYPDGTFKPDDAITRAELAAIAARFAEIMNTRGVSGVSFSDIEGHWARDSVMYAASIGWVNGYPDGTFRPDQPITRAEFMTLVNRMLERVPETVDDLLSEGMVTWSDNANPDAWYYLAVQEATNSHMPEYKDKAIPNLQFNYEQWVEMIPNRDWSQLEKAWSDAN